MSDRDRTPPQQAPTRLHDLEVVAERLDVCTRSVRRLVERGLLPAYRIGRLLKVSEEDIQEYLNQHRY
jgi:excisionase family DNA binding protein